MEISEALKAAGRTMDNIVNNSSEWRYGDRVVNGKNYKTLTLAQKYCFNRITGQAAPRINNDDVGDIVFNGANGLVNNTKYTIDTSNSNSGGGCYGEKHQSSHTVHWTDSMCCSNCQEGPHAHFPGNPYGACGSFNPNWERTETETWYTVNCGISEGYLCGKTAGVTIDGSSKSYGGNSNLSTTDTLTNNRTSLIGSQTGNGVLHLKVVNGNVLNGLENNTYLNNTVVRDKSNPNSVGEISYQDLNNKRIVEWEIPDSNGTEYEFKAQTYKINFDSQNGTDLIMDTEFN